MESPRIGTALARSPVFAHLFTLIRVNIIIIIIITIIIVIIIIIISLSIIIIWEITEPKGKGVDSL